MTEKEYRSHPAISRSELWEMRKTPRMFKYIKDNGTEPTPALLFGQAFHKLALEPDSFFDEYAIMPDIDRRTKEGKEVYARFVQDSCEKIILDRDLFDQITGMCESLKSEPLAEKLLDSPRENPYFWTDPLTGEKCKCRTDVTNMRYSNPIIVDVKSTNDASTEAFIKSAINYGYDFQAAMYCNGVEAVIGIRPIFVFIAVEKTPPYMVNILQADELFLRRGNNLFREYISLYHDCKHTGNWFGYLGKQNQINNLALPTWLAKQLE